MIVVLNNPIFLFIGSRIKSVFNWLEHHLLACPFKAFTNLDCPGCGIQRSLLSIFKGDLINSFKQYPATIPLIVLLVYTLAHLKLDFKYGALWIKSLYIGISLIILINYIYKIFTNQLI